MDENASFQIQNFLRLSLLRNGGGFSLGDLYGPMGDFSDHGGKADWSGGKGGATEEPRPATSRYRQAWEMFSDDARDEDDFADELAHRAILSATMNEGDDEDFGLARPTDTAGRKPVNYQNQPRKKVVPVESLLKDKYKKSPSKLDRKIRRLKSGQDSVEDVVYMAEEVPAGSSTPPPNMPPGPTICLPLYTYRRMVGAELTAEGRHMQEYYTGVLSVMRQEKDGALRAQIYWQDRVKKLEQERSFYADEARHLRGLTDHLRAQIDSLKEAKRRRRTAKKQRNRLQTNQSHSSGDVRDADDEDSAVRVGSGDCGTSDTRSGEHPTSPEADANIDSSVPPITAPSDVQGVGEGRGDCEHAFTEQI